MDAGEEEDVRGRPGDKHARKIYRRCESAGVVFAEWQVTTVSGKVLSPNTPAGVGGSKSKSKSRTAGLISVYIYIMCSDYRMQYSGFMR